MVDETNVTNRICSYYRSVEVRGSYYPCVNMMKQNPPGTASPSVHSAAPHSDITWHSALLPWGKLLHLTSTLSAPSCLLSGGAALSSVRTAKLQLIWKLIRWRISSWPSELHLTLSSSSSTCTDNISTVSTLSLFSLIFLYNSWQFISHSYLPVTVFLMFAHLTVLAMLTNDVTPLLDSFVKFPSKCNTNFHRFSRKSARENMN